MSFIDCINNRVELKVLKKSQAEKLQAEYESLVEKYSLTMGSESAAVEAASKMIAVKADITAQKNLNTIRSAQKIKDTVEKAKAIKKENPDDFTKKMQEEAWSRIIRPYHRGTAIFQQSLTQLNDFVFKFRSTKAGFAQDVEGIIPVSKELIEPGITGTKEASAFAKGYRETLKMLLERAKRAGIIIGEIENYHPTRHNALELKRMVKTSGSIDDAFDKWSSKFMPRLDREKMIDWETGLPFSDEELLKQMRDDFMDVITNGGHKQRQEGLRGISNFTRGISVADRSKATKFYRFKSADDFLEYNREFGVGDEGLFDMYMGTLRNLSRDIAIVEEFGPNPDSVFNNIRNIIGKGKKAGWLQGGFEVLMGRTGHFDNPGDEAIYRSFQTLWNVQKSALLGTTPLLALGGDSVTVGIAAKMNGLPAIDILKQWGKLVAQDPQSKSIARSTMLQADYAVGRILESERLFGGLDSGSPGAWLASTANRASGLAGITTAGREVFTLGIMQKMAMDKGKAFSQLDPALRTQLERFQINSADWDIIRKAETVNNSQYGNVEMLHPSSIMRLKNVTDEKKIELISKIEEWQVTAGNEALNAPDPQVLSITTGAGAGDSLATNVIARSTFMFKSWPIAVLLNRFIKDQAPGKSNRIFALLTMTTVMAAMSMQASEIVKGRTPRDMDVDFWKQAFARGGGFGLLGDFLLFEHGRYGRSFIADFAGPSVGLMEDLTGATLGNVFKGDFNDIAPDLFDAARPNIPFSTIWYGRAAIQNGILDSIEEQINPDFREEQLRRQEKYREKGQRPLF